MPFFVITVTALAFALLIRSVLRGRALSMERRRRRQAVLTGKRIVVGEVLDRRPTTHHLS